MSEDKQIELDLDLDVLEMLAKQVETAINSFFEENEIDGRAELLTILISLISQIGPDVGIDRDACLAWLASAYDANVIMSEKETEDQKNWN